MAPIKKPLPTLDALLFATPEQKVMRLLLSEPTTVFTLRIIASRLKGVRGVGGQEGLMEILTQLHEMGFVDFVDNQRAVRLHDDTSIVHHLKRLVAICDLETLVKLLEPHCSRVVLFGSRSTGRARTDSDYDLAVVTEEADRVKEIAAGHPLGKALEVVTLSPSQFADLPQKEPKFAGKLEAGIVLLGSTW